MNEDKEKFAITKQFLFPSDRWNNSSIVFRTTETSFSDNPVVLFQLDFDQASNGVSIYHEARDYESFYDGVEALRELHEAVTWILEEYIILGEVFAKDSE